MIRAAKVTASDLIIHLFFDSIKTHKPHDRCCPFKYRIFAAWKLFDMLLKWLISNGNLKDDALSGITVALALVPEAIAFAFIAKIDPMVGLYGAFMVGLFTSVFGGRPGMISGATGALAVVMVDLIAEAPDHAPEGMENPGLQYLFATLILMGIIQIAFGTRTDFGSIMLKASKVGFNSG